MKNNVVLLIIIFFTFACSDEKTQMPEIGFSDFIEKDLFLSGFASNVDYIPLDNQVRFKYIYDVYLRDNDLIVASSSGILRYKGDGSFLNRIGRIGRGPGEYRFGVSTAFDPKTRSIFVCNSQGGNTVLKYDLEGNYLDKFKVISPIDTSLLKKYQIGQFYSDIAIDSSGCFLFAPNSYGYINYSWIRIDINGNILSKKKNFIPEFNLNGYYSCQGGYYKMNGRTCFWELFNDTIFELNNRSYSSKYIFKQDKYRLTPTIASRLSKTFEFGKNVYQDYMEPRALFETPQYLFLRFRLHNNNYWAVNDKKKRIWEYCISGEKDEKEGFVNDFDGGVPFNPSFIRNMDDAKYLIDYVEAYQLKAYVSSVDFKNSIPKYPEKKRELEEFANRLSENDNPVLMLVKLKELHVVD